MGYVWQEPKMKNAGNIQEGSSEYVTSMQQLCKTGSYKLLSL